MPIKYRVGDLLKAEEPYIAHGCNAQGVMGSGVAKVIRAKWPEAYAIYAEQHELHGLKLGEVVYVHAIQHLNPVICNCITQDFYGRNGERYADYDAIRKCMKDLNKTAQGEAIAMPKIGAGLGGGDWSVISKIIEEEIEGPVTVYVLNDSEIPDGPS